MGSMPDTPLMPGDTVRIPSIPAVGRVVAISSGLKIKKWPIVVRVPGQGERSFALDEIEKLPDQAWAPLPMGGPLP